MSLNGIDISDYQRGINLAAVPADFVIVKVTQGTWYVSGDWRRQAQQTQSTGKLLGLYHYIEGSDPNAQADYFLFQARGYLGKAPIFLDWEGQDNSRYGDLGFLQQVVNAFISKTGTRPLVYTPNASYAAEKGLLDRLNCGTWAQQYATNDPVYGYQANPWNEQNRPCAVRQYSSAGRLNGYAGNLDLDKFYGDAKAWMAYAAVNGKAQPAPSKPAQSASVNIADLATRTIRGEFGNGAQRQAALGSNYSAVMAEVNRRLGASGSTRKSVEQIATEVIAGQWGNDPQRSQKLRAAGYDPSAVQKIVNQRMGAGAAPAKASVDTVARQIVRGGAANPWGNEPQRSARLRAAGYDPAAVQRRVNQLMG